jgi:anti-sigma factor RsiW
MNVDTGIKLQAYLDGELTGREAEKIAALIANDAEARSLFNELQQTHTLLAANEPEFRLPESREFFWSKIEREISRVETAPVESRGPGWIFFFRRHLAAFAGTSVAAVLVLFVAFQMNVVPRDLFEEIDNPLDETSSFSFRSESQKMTLVWISNPFADTEEAVDVVPTPVEEIQ